MNLEHKFLWIPYFGYIAAIIEDRAKAIAFLASTILASGAASGFIFGLQSSTIGILVAIASGFTLLEAYISSKRHCEILGWRKDEFGSTLHHFLWRNMQEVSLFLLPYVMVSLMISSV